MRYVICGSYCEHDDGCGRKKNSHDFDLPLFYNKSKQFLAPGGLSAECVQVSVMLILDPPASREPRGPKNLQMFFFKLVFGYVTEGQTLFFDF